MIPSERYPYTTGAILLGVGILFTAGSLSPYAEVSGDLPIWGFTLIGLAFAIPGAALAIRAYLGRAHDTRLLQTGTKLDAFVTDTKPDSETIGANTGWYVSYRYIYKGRAFTGKSPALSGVGAGDLKHGDKVEIMIDPANPQDSLLLYS